MNNTLVIPDNLKDLSDKELDIVFNAWYDAEKHAMKKVNRAKTNQYIISREMTKRIHENQNLKKRDGF